MSPSLQARYVGEGAYQAYRTPRVDLLIQFLYRDEPDVARFQSGLVTSAASAEARVAAFELPLAETARTGAAVSFWGQLRAPATASAARLQRKSGSTWVTVATIRSRGDGTVTLKAHITPGTWVRLTSGSVVGTQILVR